MQVTVTTEEGEHTFRGAELTLHGTDPPQLEVSHAHADEPRTFNPGDYETVTLEV